LLEIYYQSKPSVSGYEIVDAEFPFCVCNREQKCGEVGCPTTTINCQGRFRIKILKIGRLIFEINQFEVTKIDLSRKLTCRFSKFLLQHVAKVRPASFPKKIDRTPLPPSPEGNQKNFGVLSVFGVFLTFSSAHLADNISLDFFSKCNADLHKIWHTIKY
jgi:hypothetical protein